MSRPRQGRLVVLVNIAVGVGMIAVIASVSLYRQEAKPPSLSEFAPAGGRALTDLRSPPPAPVEPTQVRPSPVPLTRPVGAPGMPKQLACYGWPDGTATQTFDPQSPACVDRWDVTRGNSGTTATGVSGTTIRVGVPRSALARMRPYAAYFSIHFQLYGRSLQLVGLDLDLRSAEGQRAAATAAEEQELFAVLLATRATSGPDAVPSQFLDVASQKRIVSFVSRPTQASSTALSALSPYAWSYSAGMDVLQQAAGDVVCELLTGRRASLSPEQSERQRRFGIVAPDADHAGGEDLDTQTIESALDDCHSSAQVERVDPTSPTAVTDALRRLKVAGVTTVLPYLNAAPVARVLMPAAEELSYRPEWVLTGIDADPAESTWAAAPAKQLRALAGLASWQPSAAAGLRPANQALPGAVADEAAYRSLLMLASGIQLAGPTLTPEALNTGLSGSSFPNPGAGKAPQYQARVGFDDLDHGMVDDVALARWQPGSSGFCLVGGGTRWVLGSLPASDPGLIDTNKECS